MEPGLLKSADWPALIDVYFFLGGIAGGAFVIATIANLLDVERYRDVVRIGYYVAFLAVTAGLILLTVDLSVLGGQRGDALARLMRFTAFALVVQLAALALFVLTVSTTGSTGIARALAQLIAGPYGVPFWLGAVVIGIVVPLALQFAGVVRKTAPAVTVLVSVLIL